MTTQSSAEVYDEILESVDGWQVCGEAVDGQDGIEKAKELTPDLIMMDLSMPRLKRGIATI